MSSIGVIGYGIETVTDVMRQKGDVYFYNLYKPLELMLFQKNKISIFNEIKGYFHPISEMIKMIDGPLFIYVEKSDPRIGDILHQIEEAVPSYDPLYNRTKPSVHIDTEVCV